jgi:hypothetical protein
MFKKRAFLLKVVPDPQATTSQPEDRWRPDYNNIRVQATDSIAKLMATYILADTARKILIHTAESKIR